MRAALYTGSVNLLRPTTTVGVALGAYLYTPPSTCNGNAVPTFLSSRMFFIRRLSLPSASPNSSCKNSEYETDTQGGGCFWLNRCLSTPEGYFGSGDGGHWDRVRNPTSPARRSEVKMPRRERSCGKEHRERGKWTVKNLPTRHRSRLHRGEEWWRPCR